MTETVLFNINDITVLFTGFLSLALAILMFRRPVGRIKKQFWLFLSLFFFLGTLNAIDTLVYWSPSINAVLSAHSANYFFLGGFVFFLQGPLLYGFTKAAIYRQFSITKKDYWHLLPTLLYPFYIYAIYFQFDASYKMQFVQNWNHVVASPYFSGLIWCQRLFVFGYSLLCANMLYQYAHHLKNTQISLSKVDVQWLNWLVMGFLWINGWVVLTLIESRFTSLGINSFMGRLESYSRFIYVCALVVYLLQHSKGLAEIRLEHTFSDTPVVDNAQQQFIEKLQAYMLAHKPYLELHLTVDRLANRLDVSAKTLSNAINGQLHMNFFEVISFYRIEESKRQLADVSLRDLSINDVMKSCGFNSKSVFNQAFKKTVGVTPSQYRQQHQG